VQYALRNALGWQAEAAEVDDIAHPIWNARKKQLPISGSSWLFGLPGFVSLAMHAEAWFEARLGSLCF